MSIWNLPWLELSMLLPLFGALAVSRIRAPIQAFRFSLTLTGATLACALLACIQFYLRLPESADALSIQKSLLGREIFRVDELSAPLVAMVAILHFLTVLATGRTKMRRFSFAWSQVSEAIGLATFSSLAPWLLIGLLVSGTIPAYLELVNRRKPTRVYLFHMGLFVALLVIGWAFVNPDGSHQTQTAWATIPLMAAILIRCGTVPAHCWITDWFTHASFGNALLFMAPLTGVYAAVRLVLPITPDWVLQSIGIVSLVTAVYAAGMATIQREGRRLFAYLFISHASLVLVGMEMVNSLSLTGALCMWFSVTLALGGLGLTLRALEARVGRLSLSSFRGLYDSSPALAVCFLLTGLGSVGFPGTLGFVAADLVVDGAIEANLYVGLGAVAAAALNGIAIVRAYFLLFNGTRHASTVSLKIGLRERFAVLALASLILVGGLFPQPGVKSRHRAAEAILKDRAMRIPVADVAVAPRAFASGAASAPDTGLIPASGAASAP